MSSAALVPPPDGDVTRAPTLLGVFVTLTALAMVCLAARLYARFVILKAPGWDDAILVFCMFVLIVPNLIFTGIMTKFGLGRHIYYVPQDHVLWMLRWALVADPFGTMATCIPKFAVVIFLQKCLIKVHQPSIYALYALVVAVNVAMLLNTIFLYVRCHPVSALWTPGVEPVCWDPSIVINFSYFVGAFSAFCDLVLALYPLTFVPQLQMQLKQKVALCCVMGLGVFACGSAIARTTTLEAASYSADTTWSYENLLLWAGIESNVITICASLPAAIPLFLHKKRSRADRSRQSSYKTSDTRTSLRRNPSFDLESTEVASSIDGKMTEKLYPGRILATTEVLVQHGQP